jgi:peptidoglycan/xylan/chitin deacetylase (PgdA/CDA1 family)
LFLFDQEELKGIVPLVRYSAKLGRGRWVGGNILSYCGSNDLFGDQVDVICAPGETESCADALLHFLSTEYSDWDVLELPLVKSDSGLAMCAEKIARERPGGHATEWRPASTAPYIRPGQRSFEEYVKTLDGHQRYEMRKRSKGLADKDLLYGRCDAGGVDEGIETLFALHTARAKQKRMRSTFDSALHLRFHKDFAARAAQQGWLCLRFLKRGTDTIAAFYGFQIGGSLHFYQTGFDPAWVALSPGKAIIDATLREAFASGCSEYNFLQGDEQYKSTWTRDHYVLFFGCIYNRSVLGKLNRVFLRSKRALRNTIDFARNAARPKPRQKGTASKGRSGSRGKQPSIMPEKRRVSVLMYHEVSAHGPQGSGPHHLTPAYDLSAFAFNRQMLALAQAKYRSVTCRELDHIDPTAKNIVITFDDGLVGNYLQALPILKLHGLRAVFFVAVGSVGDRHYMNWDQLRELCREGMEVQSHTVTHRPLHTLSSEEIRRELVDSKARIEQELQQDVTALSFPHGSYNKLVVQIAAEVGYKTLLTSEPKCNPPSAFAGTPAILGRVAVTSQFSMRRFGRCAGCEIWEMRRQLAIKKAKNLTKQIIGIDNYRRLYRRFFNISPPQI